MPHFADIAAEYRFLDPLLGLLGRMAPPSSDTKRRKTFLSDVFQNGAMTSTFTPDQRKRLASMFNKATASTYPEVFYSYAHVFA